MHRYEAVLFDWMLTLAHYPNEREHVRRAHEALGREVDARVLDAIVSRLITAARDDDVVAAMARADCSVASHRTATMHLFERAGVDAELAATMYGLLGEPTFHPIYQESARVLRGLGDSSVRVAVISDIHVDLHTHAAMNEIDDYVDEWILSCEHGIQKPDLAFFQLALDALGVSPANALMVGDRASHDGAAAELGIDTLILPARSEPSAVRSDRLDVVLRLVGENVV